MSWLTVFINFFLGLFCFLRTDCGGMEKACQVAASAEKPVRITATVTPFPMGVPTATAALVLYMHDQRLADAPATLVGTQMVTFTDGVDGGNQVVVAIEPNLRDTRQVGMCWNEMLEPSLYVALDVAKSSVTYDGGPVFSVQPGDEVAIQLKL